MEFNLEAAGTDLPGGPIQDQWKKAIASDGFSPSNYAKTNDVEDFAESERLYQEVKGTPNEAQARAMFPARFALLDRIYSGDLKKYGSGGNNSNINPGAPGGGGKSGGGDSGSVPAGEAGSSGSGSTSAFGTGPKGGGGSSGDPSSSDGSVQRELISAVSRVLSGL